MRRYLRRRSSASTHTQSHQKTRTVVPLATNKQQSLKNGNAVSSSLTLSPPPGEEYQFIKTTNKPPLCNLSLPPQLHYHGPPPFQEQQRESAEVLRELLFRIDHQTYGHRDRKRCSTKSHTSIQFFQAVERAAKEEAIRTVR